MTIPSSFWELVRAQLDEVRREAKTADDVLRIMSSERNPYGSDWDGQAGDGFFAGSGGDDTLWGALVEAGWTVVWSESNIYWVAQAPNGDKVTYIEGDIYRGDKRGE